ncbi:MAG TPA: BamA/TamA family outer membrane protein, partial [Chthoniobacterales bacterium]|nr:BamA/TamA family outer membrane protein [Chthoniobacterales bacterium]
VFYDCGFVNADSWDFSPDTFEQQRGVNAQATLEYAKQHPGFTPPASVIGPKRTWDAFASDFGIGVRLDLPIGPLRLDYGFPIEEAGNAKHGHLNFSVGYQF